MVMLISNPSPWNWELRRPEVQGHSWLVECLRPMLHDTLSSKAPKQAFITQLPFVGLQWKLASPYPIVFKPLLQSNTNYWGIKRRKHSLIVNCELTFFFCLLGLEISFYFQAVSVPS